MKIGYIRTSKKDQNPDLQRGDLEVFGCERVFEEQISSRKAERPELAAAMDYCREGDSLVVWKLDRLGRSLRELIDLVNGLQDRGVEFVSLRESLDTTTPGGKLVFHVFASVAEFERDVIRERTMAGLEAARVRGRRGGRKPVMDRKKIALASKLMRDRETPVSEVCEAVGVSRATIYRYLEPDGTPRRSAFGVLILPRAPWRCPVMVNEQRRTAARTGRKLRTGVTEPAANAPLNGHLSPRDRIRRPPQTRDPRAVLYVAIPGAPGRREKRYPRLTRA